MVIQTDDQRKLSVDEHHNVVGFVTNYDRLVRARMASGLPH